MPIELYLTFVAASVLLILMPGPNVGLIVANSIAHGRNYGLVTVAGTSTALAVQLLITAFGMHSVLGLLADWFEWLRWIGVAYLLFLGVQVLRAPPDDLTKVRPQPRSRRAIYLRGFLVSMTNPKLLLFFGAFFPQFLSPEHGPLGPQIALLATTTLVIGVALDSCWALLAGRFRGVLAMRGRLRNRLTGGLYLAAGLGLATARRG